MPTVQGTLEASSLEQLTDFRREVEDYIRGLPRPEVVRSRARRTSPLAEAILNAIVLLGRTTGLTDYHRRMAKHLKLGMLIGALLLALPRMLGRASG